MRYFDPMQGQIVVEAVQKKDFSDEKRKQLAKEGKALPDGSYPIENKNDLRNAIDTAGMGSDPKAEIKAHIKARAKDLGAEDMLPDSWKAKKDETADGLDPDGLEPDANQVIFKPGPYTDIMRQRHPVARLQTPKQFERVSGTTIQPQDVPNAHIAPTPGLAK